MLSKAPLFILILHGYVPPLECSLKLWYTIVLVEHRGDTAVLVQHDPYGAIGASFNDVINVAEACWVRSLKKNKNKNKLQSIRRGRSLECPRFILSVFSERRQKQRNLNLTMKETHLMTWGLWLSKRLCEVKTEPVSVRFCFPMYPRLYTSACPARRVRTR